MKVLTYLHNCNSGDLIAALLCLQEAYRKCHKKAIIYQVLDMPGHYMPGLIHSVKNDKGIQVTFNQKMFDMMRPLLLAQEYIEDFQVYDGQKIDIDLTIIRESVVGTEDESVKPHTIIRAKQFVNIPYLPLPTWLMVAFPNLACDISKPWISLPEEDVEDSISDYVLVNRTERYKSLDMDYRFLKKYQSGLLFIGTEKEHYQFCKEFELDFSRLQVENFLELAQALRACRFFIGNQSFPWNLANAMGVPRILEMFDQAPNCLPFVGEDNYGTYWTEHFEYHFEQLYNKKAVPSERLGS